MTTALGRLGHAARELHDFFLPARCLGCERRLALDVRDAPVCGTCRSRLREPPWPRCGRCHAPTGSGRVERPTCHACAAWPAVITGARSAVVLEPPADRLVYALKYEGWRELAPLMGSLMAATVAPPERPDVLVPVPTTKKRKRRRGYNQAGLLAASVAGHLDRPRVDVLSRPTASATQVALHPAQRRSNVRDAFRTIRALETRVHDRTVGLVDDVLTTGSTAAEAARTLERAGAKGVTLLTFARALERRRG